MRKSGGAWWGPDGYRREGYGGLVEAIALLPGDTEAGCHAALLAVEAGDLAPVHET